MRICKFFFLVLVLICPQLSWGECKPVPCNTSSNNDRISTRNLEKKGSKNEPNCYVCEDEYCEDGDIVFLSDYSKFKICKQSVNWIGNDTWNEYSGNKCSQNHEIFNEDYVLDYSIRNAHGNMKIEYYLPDAKIYDYSGVFERKDGISPCYYFVCKDGYVPSEDKANCISFEEKLNEQKCIESHGDINQDGECFCAVSKNLEPSADGKTCVCKYKHTWNDGEQKCVHDDKNDCDTTGGTWNSTNNKCECKAQYTKKSGTKCVCESSDYGWVDGSDKTKGCKITNSALKKNECDTAKKTDARVYWDSGECKCKDDKNSLEFKDNQCIEKKEYKQCKNLGAQAKWDDINGECKCRDLNKTFNNGECMYTKEYLSEQDKLKKAAEKKTTEEHIKDFATKNLDSVVANFDRSKWRDIDGNFNTARLASDSVAAVVLGTAGGLISSKVIKKKQVENGFEDIKCTIGNQEVADWGDEFQVGIQ